MERWNVGYRQIKEINPGIIYISKTGFGQWGQYAKENRPSNDGGARLSPVMPGCQVSPAKAPQEPVIYL